MGTLCFAHPTFAASGLTGITVSTLAETPEIAKVQADSVIKDDFREKTMEAMQFIKDWIIPIGALVLSVWYSARAKGDSDRAELILKQVHVAISGWQAQIMESTKNILDSTPQVIDAKVKLAKIETAQSLIKAMQTSIQHSATNPQPGAYGHTQTENLKEMGSQLAKILDGMK